MWLVPSAGKSPTAPVVEDVQVLAGRKLKVSVREGDLGGWLLDNFTVRLTPVNPPGPPITGTADMRPLFLPKPFPTLPRLWCPD
jgi:hypothetical protein